MEKIVAIVGPTASGKSSLAVRLAKDIGGEIISCDSMQVYRQMDIGTAKIMPSEMDGVKHHLIDILDPDTDFSCADYASLAREKITEITRRGRLPIFCGGTGLYLDSVIEIPSFCDTAKDEDYRIELEKYAKENGAHALHELLSKIDPKSAEQIHENNVKRVIRALEIYKCTGVTKSEWDEKSRLQAPPYDSTVFFLSYENKALLYERIEKRVDMMLESGLLDEARGLFNKGFLENGTTASEAIGYKELLPYLKGEKSLDECVSDLKLSTRHYAKRQLTWFSRKNSYHKIYVDKTDAYEYIKEVLSK